MIWADSALENPGSGGQSRLMLHLVSTVGIARLVKLAQLALAIPSTLKEIPCQLDGLLFRVCLQNCKAAYELPCLNERAISYADFATGPPYTSAQGRRQAALGRHQPASLHPFFD